MGQLLAVLAVIIFEESEKAVPNLIPVANWQFLIKVWTHVTGLSCLLTKMLEHQIVRKVWKLQYGDREGCPSSLVPQRLLDKMALAKNDLILRNAGFRPLQFNKFCKKQINVLNHWKEYEANICSVTSILLGFWSQTIMSGENFIPFRTISRKIVT